MNLNLLSIADLDRIEIMEEKEASNFKLDPNDGMKEPLEMEEEKSGIDSITNCTFWGQRENGNLQKAMIHTVDHQAVYHLILWTESQRVGVDDLANCYDVDGDDVDDEYKHFAHNLTVVLAQYVLGGNF